MDPDGGGVPPDNRCVTDRPERSPTDDPSNVEESVAALDRVLDEMEVALRDLGSNALSATQVDRTLRRLGADLRRLRAPTVPAPVRRAAAEADERISEAILLVTPDVVQRASQRASRTAVDTTRREAARLVARAGL